MMIRLAAPTELEAVRQCETLAFHPYVEPPPASSDTNEAPADPSDDLAAQIAEGHVHVMAVGDQILGYVSCIPADDHLFIDAIAVLPHHQNSGIGSRLLAHAEGVARRSGLSCVRLFTMANMTDSMTFYERRGYQVTSRCNDDGYPRIFYAKDVASSGPALIQAAE